MNLYEVHVNGGIKENMEIINMEAVNYPIPYYRKTTNFRQYRNET